MPRRAHRRCKEQGPTCNGVAHPGYDICARCLNDVVRVRRREEKAAVKSRRAMRAMHNKLSKENRELISEVDLKEPQMRPEEPTWLTPDSEPAPPARTVGQAIGQLEIDKKIAGIPSGPPKIEALMDIIIKDELKDVPVDLHPRVPERYRRHMAKPPEEEPVPEPVVQEPVKPPNGRRHRQSRLTPDQVDEILEAFKSEISTTEIQQAYGIGAQTLYTLVRRAGLPLRGQNKRLPKEETVSEPVKTSPPASPDMAEEPTPNGAVSGLTEWVVTYEVLKTETVTVAAKTFNDAAAAAVGDLGIINVVSVARKRSIRVAY
jgi:hypothetical protein